MAAKKRNGENKGNPQAGSLKLIYALNAIATTLQESIQSEENVYEVFHNQIVALGLRGDISLLDEDENVLVFKTAALPNSFKKVPFTHWKKAQGYTGRFFSSSGPGGCLPERHPGRAIRLCP